MSVAEEALAGAVPHLADPIAMEVFSNRLLSVADDMGSTLVRSSFSTNIKERKDCSVALFDARGRLIAQASHVPLHLGSLMGSVEAVLAAFDIADIHNGDAFMCNDPYLAGGTHMPDISVITPVFVGGLLRFFTANIGHHSDVGGPIPGSISAASPTVFHEGLRIPVVRVVDRGVVNEPLIGLVACNSRDVEERTLDLKAQIATNERGKRLMSELTEHLGVDHVLGAIEDILAYTSARLRARVQSLREGVSVYSAYLDDDGVTRAPVELRCKVTVRGDELEVDFSGSAPQAAGALNVPPSALNATVYYAVKALLDPGLLPNSGMFECIRIHAERGTILDPVEPASVGARSITCSKVARALFGAFAEFLPPERMIAASQDIVPGLSISGAKPGGRGSFVYAESIGGGGGALAGSDGADAIHVHITNTSNLPVEALENEYPLLVEAYALVEDSGGAGRYRGGLGIARQIRAMADDIVVSARLDGYAHGAPGFAGGQDGGLARVVYNFGRNDERELPCKLAPMRLPRGASIRIETPGGGGFGPSAERDGDRILDDIRSGKLSPERAKEDYGFVKGEAPST